MNSFLKTISLFFIILLGYLAATFSFNTYQIDTIKIPFDHTSVLIVGDSYFERAINPELFIDAQNISQSAEPLFVSYWKIKYLSQKIKIDTLLLSFSHHSFSGYNDQKLEDKTWAYEIFRRVYPIIDVSEISVKYDLKVYYNVYFRNMFLYPKTNYLNFMGAYEPSKGNSIAHIEKAIKRHFYKADSVQGISEVSLHYLDSILELCASENIVPVLVSTPITQQYYAQIPPLFIDNFETIKDNLKKKRVLILDYSQPAFEDVYFKNGDHLNKKGSTKFTHQIIRKLKIPPR